MGEPDFPGPASRKVQGEAACRACEASDQGEEASSEGLGCHHLLAQPDAVCPACQVVGHHLYGHPGGIGGEAARWEMVESDAVLEVADSGLDHCVAAMVGLQLQGIPVAVGDQGVIAVVGEERQLRAGRGLFTLRTMSRT